jgi:signal transduction histidine kinase
VAEIVAAHGGTISVGASPLGGARFEVVLPRQV